VNPRPAKRLQALPAWQQMDDQQGDHRGAARAGGFSLHADAP
jgi:hypothetical protein